MYSVYVIRNQQGVFYKGQTSDLPKRMQEHNNPDGSFKSFTKNKGPWELIYSEEYSTRSEAMLREKFLKTGKGRDFLKGIIKT